MNEALHEIFKSYDIRGKVGSQLTPEVLNRIGQALALWLPKEGVVAVGRDMRPDSEALAAAMIEGLRAQGRDVWDIGEVTTDMIYFAVGHFGLAGGAVVTASHNPGEYNGIKICRDAAGAVGQASGLFEIKDMVIANDFPTPKDTPGTLEHKDLVEDWVQHVLSFIDASKLKPLSVAVDAGNGMAGKIFPELEPYVPWEVHEMYFELDGTFPNHEANPLKFETLADVIKVIKDNRLDGGIAFDGDGDRAFLIDETGEVLTGGVMSAMIAEYFLKQFPGSTIVYDARNSRTVPEVVEAQGGKPLRTVVGHSNIKLSMKEADAPFGGEGSGHFYFRDNWYADSGLIAAVIGMYVAQLSGKKLSELRKQYTHYHAIPETNYDVSDKQAMMDKVEAAFPDAEIDHLDGVTISLSNGSWLNLRPSNTESILRLNVEAKSKAELDTLVAKVTDLITQ